VVEGQDPGGERGQRLLDVLPRRVVTRQEERLHGARPLAHLPDEEEQARHVAAVVEAVLEPGQRAGGATGVQPAHGVRRRRPQRLQDTADAALDLHHVAVREDGGDQPHDLAVRRCRLPPHELQRVGVHEPMVVVPVQGLEARAKPIQPHEEV
jgi:hypothetical protein